MPIYKKIENGYVKKTPSGYKDLEYIESTGAQYIDTGYYTQSGDVFKTKIIFTTINSSAGNEIYGVSGGYVFGVQSSSKWEWYNGSWVQSSSTASINTAYNLEVSYKSGDQYISINGTKVLTSTSTTSNVTNYTSYLFTMNEGNSPYSTCCKLKMYNFEIRNSSNVLVRNYIPALRESDNVAGLYDLVNNVFYPSASSTAFVAGPVLSDVYEITPDLGDPHKELVKIVYGGKITVSEDWTYKEGKFIDMTSNTVPSPFIVTYDGSGQYSKSGEYWHAFDDDSSTSLTLSATKTEYDGTNGYHNVSLKFGKPIRVVEWTATGSCTSSDNYRYASLEMDSADVGEKAVFDGTYTKNYSDTELGYVEADGIHLSASRTVYGSSGGTSSATFKDVQITKWYEGGSARVVERIIWEGMNTPFEETRTATSSSHYSCGISWDENDLANCKVTKVVVYTPYRGLSGDGHTTINVTTKGGTRIYKDKYNYYYSSGTTEEGVNYTMVGEDLSGKARITITFEKPVQLTVASGWCGSGVGQWRETDEIQMTLTGLTKRK